MRPISILFARQDSVYKTLDVDVWDIERDARKWIGGNPVVCHPPCRAWGQLSHMAKPRPDEKDLAVFAVNQIRKFGGVLEHPSGSKLWAHMDLPMPGRIDQYGGFSLCVNQSWFGHKAEKRTLLYICGITKDQLPPVPIRFDRIDYTVASKIKKHTGRRLKKEITKREREQTPIEMAKWLIAVCEIMPNPLSPHA